MAASSPSSPPERPPVSAVVVNYNAGEALVTCVESLFADGAAEVVVVDNDSADASLDKLRSKVAHPHLAILTSPRNLGYGGGANLGVAAASAPLVLIANPDLVLRRGALAALSERLLADERTAVVGPMLRDPEGDVYPSGRAFPGLADAVGHAFLGLVWGGNPWTRRYRHLGADQHRSREADWVSGACLLVRRVAFESVSGFDESYFMYVEDVDICWRLRRAGWHVWYEPGAEVQHEQGRSTSLHPYRMLAAHHRSMWLFARRSSTGSERWLLPFMSAGLLARLLLAWADHLLRPVREELLPTAKVRHRARGEFQP
ncbi:MAG: glycosyltransferase family 2 protein [Acidimicrobiales bacterium]